jgi:polyisoprenoid-binding protein YceI
MKNILFFLLFCSFTLSIAQGKYLTKTGTIHFEASVPSFEEVASKNENVTAILNTENGEFAALALVKGFRFKNALMEEHFNENYAESHLYPKATFKGKIQNFDISNTQSEYIVSGELTFHGVSKALSNITVTLEQQNGNYILSGNFSANPSDYNIEIPKIVKNKIADSVDVTFEFQLQKK